MKRIITTLAIIFSLLGAGGFAMPMPASAQVDTGLNAVGATVGLPTTDPRVIAARIINISLGLLGIIMVSLILYGGFLYMTSAGEADKTEKAKKYIRNAIIGLIIILSSWAIARFVIDNLLKATQEGAVGGGGPSMGTGGGFAGAGVSNVFQVKSITPQGAVSIRNIKIKLLFSRPVDDKSVSAIAITKDGGVGVGGAFEVSGSVVVFTPADACPAPNESLKCFDADSDFTVQVGSELHSTTGQTIVCGGFAPPCTAKFHTGNLIDTQPPKVNMILPLDGQAVPADSLVTLGANATDDSGIAYLAFEDNNNPVDEAAPSASSTPLSFEGQVEWDTTGIPLQSIRQLTAKAFDIDDHSTQSAPVKVVVRSPSCFDGVQNGDETAVDCGGTPNTPGYCGACSGGSCVGNSDCASSVCQAGKCVEQPTITGITPQDGAAGSFVTIKGLNFGTAGTVVFLGGAGAGDDKIAKLPLSCTLLGMAGWSPTEVIVAVPDGAASGPLSLTNSISGLSDATDDSRGPLFQDFTVNDNLYPGLCGLDPTSGFAGDQFKAIGQGFGTAPDAMLFGASNLSSFSSWTDNQIVANVPVVGVGKHAVKVKVGANYSNPVNFSVASKATAGPPVILSLDPQSGPRGEYITLLGNNFGYSVGTVRFKNKTTEQEALGDTIFPPVCADGYWTGNNVIVKVPQEFLINKTTLIPGDYSVRLVRSDNVESNAMDFVVTSGNAKPGICAISPTVGPVGTAVTLSGERFGADTGNATFYSEKAGVVSSWTNGEVKTSVPAGAVTGPVTLSAQGVKSNPVNFQVRNCNEEPGVCSLKEQCCGNGTCMPQNQACGVVSQKAMFAWQSSTGLIPVAPRVVEECLPNETQPPVPSPSPWDKRAGGDNVCINSSIRIRFTTHLDETTVNKANFRLKKCTSESGEPCATSQNVELNPASPLLQTASQDQDYVLLESQALFDTDSTYLVEILTGIKGEGVSGAYMDENTACGQGVAYCFRFKTRATPEACAIGAVSVAPHPFELNDIGKPVNYLASPIASNDKCIVLRCENYDWTWEHGDKNDDGRAIFQMPFKMNTVNSNKSCRQTGIAVMETGDNPVHMNATAMPDSVKGTGFLYVKFIPPQVQAYAPNCNMACTNALIWARFSSALDPASIADNVEVRPCANENCIETELGQPLPIPQENIKLLSIPGSGEKDRYLSIEAKKPGANQGEFDLLLLQGKYYRVLLKGGGDTGIKGLNGVPMTGLNHPEGFVWKFRVKLGEDAFCTALKTDVTPVEKYEKIVGARQLFVAMSYGKPDECSATGQALIQTADAQWDSSDKDVADFFNLGGLDTGAALPAQCSAQCLALGSQAEYGKAAVCGKSGIETTDANYCKNGKTPFGDDCAVLPPGAKAGEQCDPSVLSNAGQCDENTCLWKPVAQVPSGKCGNGQIDFGEMCDFGSQCQGASPTSTTPNGTDCTANKTACEANGGTCAPRQYRGCSPFCRHTGSSSGGSTCGNGDIADGEDCDDGNLTNGDGCSSMCLHEGSIKSISSVCGNGIMEPGEVCEKNSVNDPGFPLGCMAKTCLHSGTYQCDNDPKTVDTDCCGNATVDNGEDCDDGNKTGGDGCSAGCLLEGSSVNYPVPSFCSDGLLGKGEQCEAGLPSSDKSLQVTPNNAVPQPPKGSLKGDGVVDYFQLAYIIGDIGDAEPDASGKMTSKITAVLDGKTGEAKYGLQCGQTDESACGAGYGLTDKGCCSLRPIAIGLPSGAGICRNALIKAKFNVAMDAASVSANVRIAKQDESGVCPTGTTQVADDFSPVKRTSWSWLKRLWLRVVSWWTGDPAYAAVWCVGSVPGSWVPASKADSQNFVFKLINALEPNTKYRVKFLGDNSVPVNPLGDNADLNKKVGIKTAKGVVAQFDYSADSGPLTFSFTTGKDICLINLVQVTDLAEEHPLLYLKAGEVHPYKAEALSLQDGKAVSIAPVSDYAWEWLPWTSSDESVLKSETDQLNMSLASGTAENKNGNAFVGAWVKITSDAVNPQSTKDGVVQGSVPVSVSLCENPWPNLDTAPLAPFRDKQPTGNGLDSSLTDSIFIAGPYYNFSTTYCRDAGDFGTNDDLPNLKINYVPPLPTDASEGILRQYLFTYGDENKALKKDGIGIRIVANPMHYSPEDWYKWRGFGGNPKPLEIDGYRALQDESTTYISAANTEGAGENIYSNIYVISHNPDAEPVTVGIYKQMVDSLAFNINLTKGVANVCEKGNNPNPNPNEVPAALGPYLDENGNTLECSTDFDCLKLGDDFHCGSFKKKLSRDMVRVSDFAYMSQSIDAAYKNNGFYPKLTAGTFVPGLTNSLWPSWDDEFVKVAGGSQPKDPVNKFLTCGRCSLSQSVCGQDSDCTQNQTCKGVTLEGGHFIASTSTDPQTCWDTESRTFFCPRINASPSRIYQYRTLQAGQRYELGSEFEVPPPIQKDGKWWSPALQTEVKRCANAETMGFLCTEDKDCRLCVNPKDDKSCPPTKFPIVAGACRFVGGRFLYKDICNNQKVGQSGTCGDGIIGMTCSGGTNSGNLCLKDSDCPDATCSVPEVCELGETKLVDCKTTDNKDGLKLQVCSECKEFVDDIKVTQCMVGIVCGNGKIDKQCNGGVRKLLACSDDKDCLGDDKTPAGVCSPSNEVCDDGVLNGTYGHCNIKCTGYAAYCGDSMISPGETCDLGNNNGEYCGVNCDLNQTCGADCKSKAPYCGDGILTSPEQCDGQSQSTVKAICKSGNAKDEPCSKDADCGEPVIAGACASGADLLASCEDKTAKRCATSMKQCVKPDYAASVTDNKLKPHDPKSFKVCKTDNDCGGESGGKTACRSVQEFVESCDADTQCSKDTISGVCQSYPTVHTRTCNTSGPLQCNFTVWSGCKALGYCGDGNIDSSEECDNGAENGDTKACTSICKKNICGDGKPLVGVEECDAGAQNGKITCNADYSSTCASCSTMCKFLSTAGGYCGDAKKNGPEQCDGSSEAPFKLIFNITVCKNKGLESEVCVILNPQCTKTPCMQTLENASKTTVTCQGLGYDFPLNLSYPELYPLNMEMSQPMKGKTKTCFVKDNLMKYEWEALKACMGMDCLKPSMNNPKYTFVKPQTPPSSNDFWACIKEKGPALGIGIKGNNNYEIVQCNASCGFSGCGKCSEEKGSGSIHARLVDVIYNEPVPLAKVSLFYKGVLVNQTVSDNDGKFEFQGLNDRAECSQYKIVVDKYDDNLCTGNLPNRPNCGWPDMPAWTYSYNIDEGSRGGYWPFTSKGFSVSNFQQVLGLGQGDSIWLYPRPGKGEAYYTVKWGVDIGPKPYVLGMTNNHLLLPKEFAYTVANKYDQTLHVCNYGKHKDQPCKTNADCNEDSVGICSQEANNHICLNYQGPGNPIKQCVKDSECDYHSEPKCISTTPILDQFVPTTCDWNNRPAANHQCTRDITWAPTLKGSADLNKLPYAQLICQHKVGDVVGGKGGSDKKYNGCLVEGKDACEARLGVNNPDCNKGKSLLTEGVCKGGPNAGIDCGADSQCPKGYCDMTESPCNKTWWDSCDFYEDGPLTTYFRYAPFLGASEPVHMVWGTFSRSVYPVINAAASSLPTPLSSLFSSKKFSAIVSTDKQIVEIDATTVTTKDCTQDNCKFWHIADLDPNSGLINVKNNLLAGREGVTAAVALYEYYFQGTNPPPQKYCVCNNCTPAGAKLKWCNQDSDCPAGNCESISSQAWSQSNF